ncbi:unnamed protein product [Hermetia illucens]|uniref:Uncharacterized protein n=1 Tax=Hermetia illucens TaxID=343691 RepID=A0A7R8UPE1_HERIL|nr:uncharacterized protein LOC119653147 [Hermetia illucens]CAD7084582.1 unnamed protein product [Hermetia illucens]
MPAPATLNSIDRPESGKQMERDKSGSSNWGKMENGPDNAQINPLSKRCDRSMLKTRKKNKNAIEENILHDALELCGTACSQLCDLNRVIGFTRCFSRLQTESKGLIKIKKKSSLEINYTQSTHQHIKLADICFENLESSPLMSVFTKLKTKLHEEIAEIIKNMQMLTPAIQECQYSMSAEVATLEGVEKCALKICREVRKIECTLLIIRNRICMPKTIGTAVPWFCCKKELLQIHILQKRLNEVRNEVLRKKCCVSICTDGNQRLQAYNDELKKTIQELLTVHEAYQQEISDLQEDIAPKPPHSPPSSSTPSDDSPSTPHIDDPSPLTTSTSVSPSTPSSGKLSTSTPPSSSKQSSVSRLSCRNSSIPTDILSISSSSPHNLPTSSDSVESSASQVSCKTSSVPTLTASESVVTPPSPSLKSCRNSSTPTLMPSTSEPTSKSSSSRPTLPCGESSLPTTTHTSDSDQSSASQVSCKTSSAPTVTASESMITPHSPSLISCKNSSTPTLTPSTSEPTSISSSSRPTLPCGDSSLPTTIHTSDSEQSSASQVSCKTSSAPTPSAPESLVTPQSPSLKSCKNSSTATLTPSTSEKTSISSSSRPTLPCGESSLPTITLNSDSVQSSASQVSCKTSSTPTLTASESQSQPRVTSHTPSLKSCRNSSTPTRTPSRSSSSRPTLACGDSSLPTNTPSNKSGQASASGVTERSLTPSLECRQSSVSSATYSNSISTQVMQSSKCEKSSSETIHGHILGATPGYNLEISTSSSHNEDEEDESLEPDVSSGKPKKDSDRDGDDDGRGFGGRGRERPADDRQERKGSRKSRDSKRDDIKKTCNPSCSCKNRSANSEKKLRDALGNRCLLNRPVINCQLFGRKLVLQDENTAPRNDVDELMWVDQHLNNGERNARQESLAKIVRSLVAQLEIDQRKLERYKRELAVSSKGNEAKMLKSGISGIGAKSNLAFLDENLRKYAFNHNNESTQNFQGLIRTDKLKALVAHAITLNTQNEKNFRACLKYRKLVESYQSDLEKYIQKLLERSTVCNVHTKPGKHSEKAEWIEYSKDVGILAKGVNVEVQRQKLALKIYKKECDVRIQRKRNLLAKLGMYTKLQQYFYTQTFVVPKESEIVNLTRSEAKYKRLLKKYEKSNDHLTKQREEILDDLKTRKERFEAKKLEMESFNNRIVEDIKDIKSENEKMSGEIEELEVKKTNLSNQSSDFNLNIEDCKLKLEELTSRLVIAQQLIIPEVIKCDASNETFAEEFHVAYSGSPGQTLNFRQNTSPGRSSQIQTFWETFRQEVQSAIRSIEPATIENDIQNELLKIDRSLEELKAPKNLLTMLNNSGEIIGGKDPDLHDICLKIIRQGINRLNFYDLLHLHSAVCNAGIELRRKARGSRYSCGAPIVRLTRDKGLSRAETIRLEKLEKDMSKTQQLLRFLQRQEDHLE